MARLEQLIEQVSDHVLRDAIAGEVAELKSKKSFGLVFERHIPETALVGHVPVKVGDQVRRRERADSDEVFRVLDVGKDGRANIAAPDGTSEQTVPSAELLVVKGLGDPVYTALTPLEVVKRSEERPHHVVIEGENFHALQALTFALEGQVDCIYLDPPYNSGAADWKYNNRYVDGSDQWRHSKWLSFMEKRLRLARKLLKPNGVLIITIDENEVAHLGLLLEELFPEYLRYLITIVINPKGTAKVNFSRVEEYAFFVCPDTGEDVIALLPPVEEQGESAFQALTLFDPPNNGDVEGTTANPSSNPQPYADTVGEEAGSEEDSEELVAVGANGDSDVAYRVLHLRRRGAESSYRHQRWRQFYAINVNERTKTVVGIGPELALDAPYAQLRDQDILTLYPVDAEGNERVWRYGRDRMEELINSGEIRVGSYNQSRDTYTLNHWKPVPKDEINLRRIRTVWWRRSHDAGTHGTTLIANLLGERGAFPFPKSLYAVRDSLEAVVKNRPDALIVDFFAGSGTTLHATCLLNAADNGHRRCILVTNNEVDAKTTRLLNKSGIYRGDPEFEQHGIFHAATKPRLISAITGRRPDGSEIPSGKRYQYIDGRPFAQGFEENVEFFRLDYLDPDDVEFGDAFAQLHPLLWLAGGARGERPRAAKKGAPFIVSKTGGYAVLLDEDAFRDFEQALLESEEIRCVFLVTASAEAFAEMSERLGHRRKTRMLYRAYLRHFRDRPT